MLASLYSWFMNPECCQNAKETNKRRKERKEVHNNFKIFMRSNSFFLSFWLGYIFLFLMLFNLWNCRQTCTRPNVFVISYLLFCVHLTNFFEKKNSAACLLKTKWLMKKLNIVIWKKNVPLKMQIFISHFVEGSQLDFLSPKNSSHESM